MRGHGQTYSILDYQDLQLEQCLRRLNREKPQPRIPTKEKPVLKSLCHVPKLLHAVSFNVTDPLATPNDRIEKIHDVPRLPGWPQRDLAHRGMMAFRWSSWSRSPNYVLHRMAHATKTSRCQRDVVPNVFCADAACHGDAVDQRGAHYSLALPHECGAGLPNFGSRLRSPSPLVQVLCPRQQAHLPVCFDSRPW